MREKKFTPGPWTLEKNSSHIRGIGTVHWCGKTEEENYWYEILGAEIPGGQVERDANAVLMSTAPELLEELQYLRRFVDPEEVDCGPADAAIAKAYGENPIRREP